MIDKAFLPYAKPHLDDDDRQAVAEVLTTTQLTRGPHAEAFEDAVASYCGASYAVSFSTGTAAMHAAYFVARTSPFDHVITSPISYVGSLTGALLAGARAHFVDIMAETGNWSTAAFPNLDSTRGRPIYTPVHYRGAPVDMVGLKKSIRSPDAVVIEDAAHALGATYATGDKVGSCLRSDMTILSFNPVKSITSGEGGMVLTSDAARAQQLRQFRNNGLKRLDAEPWLYTVEFASGNSHMTDLQAALGLSQLKKLDRFIAKRRELVIHYRTVLADIPHLTLLEAESDDHSAHHLMVVLIDFETVGKKRGDVMRALSDAGIGTQVHYIPLYHHPVVKSLTVSATCPNAESFYTQALSLPLYYDLTKDDVERVRAALQKVLRVA